MDTAPAGGAKGARTSLVDEGVEAFVGRDLASAHVAFERAHRTEPRSPRAMSWYGVTLVLVERNLSLGLLYCDQALRTAGRDPELLLNVARVHLALNQRARAVRQVQRGLELWPGEPRLLAARAALFRRAAPVLSFLSRENVVNACLGFLRHHLLFLSRPPHPELSPVTLGELPGPVLPRSEEDA